MLEPTRQLEKHIKEIAGTWKHHSSFFLYWGLIDLTTYQSTIFSLFQLVERLKMEGMDKDKELLKDENSPYFKNPEGEKTFNSR